MHPTQAQALEALKEAIREAISAAESVGHPQSGGSAFRRAKEAEEAVWAAIAALSSAAPAAGEVARSDGMTARRAQFFMERFKHEEKLLGPNEQAALDFVIAMLEEDAPPAPSATSAECSCPSGDGSLRWPCKAHSPAPTVMDEKGERDELIIADRFDEILRKRNIEDTGVLRSTMRQAARLLRESLTAPAPSAAEPVAECRGYAVLGIGEYLLNHSAAGQPAELVISLASDEDKAGRAVGEERNNAPGGLIQPEQMVVRLRFENSAGLDALESQLRHVRAVHFAAPPAPQPTEAETVDVGRLRKTLEALAIQADTCELFIRDRFPGEAQVLRKRVAHARAALKAEAPVAEPAPTGAIINGRTYADNLEQTGLECIAGPLTLCNDWVEFRRCFEHLANWAIGSQVGTSTVIPAPSAAEDAKDGERLDFLQQRGATVDLVHMPVGGLLGFRIGGRINAVSCILRDAIDKAMAEGVQQ